MGRYGALLASPYVVTVHDLIRMLDLDREDALIHHPNVRDRLLLRLDRLGIGRAAHIVAVSEATKRDLVARLDIAPERVTVVYEGVDHARFSPVARPPVSYRYLLYVGSEQPRKDMPTLLRAFARIRADRRFSDYRLVKIGAAGGGEAPFRQATVRAMRDCGLEDAVQFLGRVPEDELPAWYSGAELFIFPSRYEGFGLPPLEAMACACPVLISDAAALREVGGGAALVAPAGDHAAFAARAIEILTNGALRRSLRQRGLARAATFSWARTARETMAVWDAVLAAVTAKRAPTFPARRLARTGVGGTGPT
jgi:glycosyltransferase involved in cell wall biosynthesis